MNELQEFNFQGNQLRSVMIDSEPFFVGKDAATAIGYSNTRKAIRDHVKAKYQREERIVTPSGLQSMTVISEPGLYQLASESKLPSAGPFQDWVYEDVLPSIRKHGAYMTPETIEKALLNPDTIINLATQLKQERSGRLVAEQQVQELKPKADYYDMILASKGLVTTTSIAMNYGMSARMFNSLLHSWVIQYKQSGSWYLYSQYQGHGYTHTVPVPYVHSDGRVDIQPSTKWTQKGHKFIYEFLKARGILPVIERETEAV